MALIKVENKKELQGAERFGECVCCGDKENWTKVTYGDENQQTSIRICNICLKHTRRTILTREVINGR